MMQRDLTNIRIASMNEEATYTCDACGEQITIPVDPSAGSRQEYVEDCHVCCHPNVNQVQISMDGRITVSASVE